MHVINELIAPFVKYERAKKNMVRCATILSKSYGYNKHRQNYFVKVNWITTKELMIALDHYNKTKHILN